MSTYIIAECGQNHNGDIEIAEELINMAAQPVYYKGKKLKGCDAVKFTIRDLEYEMTHELYRKRYNSPHRYAKKYGEHRKKLELSYYDIKALKAHAKAKDLDFILTICQDTLVEQYKPLCNKIKVASRDLDNIPLLKELAKAEKEIILSTGMTNGELTSLTVPLEILKPNHVSLLYCVSEYPTEYNSLSMNRFTFDNYDGFSDHTTGILAAPLAVALGAKIIEKHITLDREMKGTDHIGSLGPEGFHRFIRDIRNTECVITPNFSKNENVTKAKIKLGRSVAYKYDFKGAHRLSKEDVIMISPGDGLKWGDVIEYFGKLLKHNVYKNQLLKGGDIIEG